MRSLALQFLLAGFLLGLFLLTPGVEPRLMAAKPRAEFYNRAFEFAEKQWGATPKSSQGSPRGAVTNHHLLAPHLIAQTLARVRLSNPKIVVLISPNHFDRGFTGAITANENWAAPFGQLRAARYQINKMLFSKALSNEPAVLTGEHGLGNIVGFIKKIFPNARLIPLAVKESLTEEKSLALAQALNKSLPADTLFLGSFDFSHSQTPAVTRANDQKSLAVLQAFSHETFNSKAINNVSIDSRAGLKLLLEIMQLRGSTKFNLVVNTNSAELTGIETNDTTSYINGFFTKE